MGQNLISCRIGPEARDPILQQNILSGENNLKIKKVMSYFIIKVVIFIKKSNNGLKFDLELKFQGYLKVNVVFENKNLYSRLLESKGQKTSD